MSLLPPFPITFVENEDFGPLVFTYTPVANGSAADWTGYTAQMMVRKLIGDVAPLVTYVPALGGSAGTLTLSFTYVQVNALLALLANANGIYDIVLTSPGGVKSHFVPKSDLIVERSVTR